MVSSVAAERAPTPTVQRSPFDMFGVTPSEANSIKQVKILHMKMYKNIFINTHLPYNIFYSFFIV